MRIATLFTFICLSVETTGALAQTNPTVAPSRALSAPSVESNPESTSHYPRPASIQQTVKTASGTLKYQVQIGAIETKDAEDRVVGDVVYTAYSVPGQANRPITFAFNGGPGAAAVFLQFGVIGPKSIAFGNSEDYPSRPTELTDNPETWLSFTDLVFVDPIGTGFSRPRVTGDKVTRLFYSVEADANYLAQFIYDWLRTNRRLNSPVYLAGESYGGFRAPKIAKRLQSQHGVAPHGLVLLSPYLDRAYFSDPEASPLVYAKLLPAFAAAKLLRERGQVSLDDLKPVEEYARGEFVIDLLRGIADTAAVERLTERVSAFTGLDRDLVRRLGGRIDAESFRREFRRAEGRVVSAYDAEVLGDNPSLYFPQQPPGDPILDRLNVRLNSAAVSFFTETVGWKTNLPYKSLNLDVTRSWDWGLGSVRAPTVEILSDMRALMASDPNMKILVTNGMTDLVTTYFETRLALSRLPMANGSARLEAKVYPGGHMFYSRQASRAALTKDVRALYSRPAR